MIRAARRSGTMCCGVPAARTKAPPRYGSGAPAELHHPRAERPLSRAPRTGAAARDALQPEGPLHGAEARPAHDDREVSDAAPPAQRSQSPAPPTPPHAAPRPRLGRSTALRPPAALSAAAAAPASALAAPHTPRMAAPPNPNPNPTRVKEKLRTHCGTGSAFMHLTLLNEHDQVGVGVGVTVRVRVRVRVSTNPVIPNPTKP